MTKSRNILFKNYPRLHDFSGSKIGNWTVLNKSDVRYRGKTQYECLCDCGQISTVVGQRLRNGKTKHCIHCAPSNLGRKTHGRTVGGIKEPEYKIWNTLKVRCLNPNDKSFKNYGGRGITICDEWKNSYTKFIDDVGKKPFPEASLDRIDNDKGYFPGNVRWTTKLIQSGNTRKQKYGVCVLRSGAEVTIFVDLKWLIFLEKEKPSKR